MSHHRYAPYSKLHQYFSLFLITAFLFSSSAEAVSHRHKRTQSHAQKTPLGKVTLTSQPGTALENTARLLNQSDMNFAIQRNEQPLLLIGSLNLSSTKRPKNVLFTQIQTASLCGSGGCSTTGYIKRNNQWVKVLDAVTGDITVEKATHKGMHDLSVSAADVWRWNGKTYVETQRGPALKGLKQSIEKHQQKKL
ncbi:hypothetical protein [Commensalibacter communis]|uniref:hypothetical protein n=1 Tax=Commensalibacter communis TaxID=2972786 RepID=UPI0022FF6108|nr:hypothetical protein [Commensalibacter communis]CAI3935439.1 unnamed protein product [Commensalibacter communis]CAI3942775.1 unnamed protein product [Commensalibacter communis]